ncbi:ribonuclease J [Schleiferilactobacillus perolens]|jgi:ribonuclease J|uniref:Ribonuclease J n=1 Tax=Schleiferilactobacillus perolens DSM 12744 TaxID=1423792 RepID=A0A0R1N9F0_9LACO|nr:ribonuclease J [Schleiferilactobacillus perolens]KRL14170.1 metallo-beta-lactamase family hydrolase [Schleiferilactobacillus perolens DSM 12744]
MVQKTQKTQDKVRVVILGGVRENGKNIYAVEVNSDIFILDCGIKYPENEMLGVDVVIPDFSYIEENIDRVAGIFLTHGHADAIGALPYLIGNHDIPVFGSKLTVELAKITVKSVKASRKFNNFHVIDENTAIDFDAATVSFFKTTHSIPESLGVVIKTPVGQIVYTGDFKFDQAASPLFQTDFARLAQIGTEPVLALLADSANAESPYPNTSESDIGKYVLETFEYHSGRIIVASVASNIMRIQQVLDAAGKTGRKVILTGRDLAKIVRTALHLKLLRLPNPNILVPVKDIKKYDDHQLVILETGRSGEPLKSLQKMATNRHRTVHIHQGDLVFISTTPSYAMETTVAKTKDMIYRAGGEVKAISDDLHASGHAYRNDLQLLLNLVHPKYLIPIQGEYRSMNAHAEIAKQTGIPADHIFLTKIGDVLSYDKSGMHLAQGVTAGNTMIDGLGVGDIGNIVLRDRKMLADDGIFIAVVSIDRRKKIVVSAPKVTARGFVYMKANRDLMAESATIVKETVQHDLDNKEMDWSNLKQNMREKLSHFLFEQTKRHPVILPVIMEVKPRRRLRAPEKKPATPANSVDKEK